MKILSAKLLHQKLLEVFKNTRFDRQNEDMIQCAITRIADELQLYLLREYQLSRKSRLDFYHQQTQTAIEVKIKNSLPKLMSQLAKYAEYSEVQNLIVVSTKAFETYPSSINGKPIYWIPIWKNII